MKAATEAELVPAPGTQLITAMREEAAWFREDGKEAAAQRLEAQADRWEALATSLKTTRS